MSIVVRSPSFRDNAWVEVDASGPLPFDLTDALTERYAEEYPNGRIYQINDDIYLYKVKDIVSRRNPTSEFINLRTSTHARFNINNLMSRRETVHFRLSDWEPLFPESVARDDDDW